MTQELQRLKPTNYIRTYKKCSKCKGKGYIITRLTAKMGKMGGYERMRRGFSIEDNKKTNCNCKDGYIFNEYKPIKYELFF